MKLSRGILAFLCLILSAKSVWAGDIGLYVVNEGSNNVSVIDPGTDTVTATIPVGTAPRGLKALPDASFVYVANSGSDDVSVIRTSDNTVTNTIAAVGDSPAGVAVTPDGAFVYVTTQDDDSVTVIDTSNNTIIDTIAVGDFPRSLVINEAGTFAYVGNFGDDSVSVIDLADNTISDTITLPAGESPYRISINHAGTFVYTANFLDSTVTIIDLSDNSTESFATGFETLDVVPSNDDSLLYVLSAGNGLEFANASTHVISATTAAGNFPRHGIFNSAGTKFYVVEHFDNSIGIVNTTSHTRTGGIAVGNQPYDIALARTVPALTLSQNTVSFVTTQEGNTSNTETVTLTSTGTEDLSITTITASTNFSQTNDCPALLSPGDLCTIAMTFTPTAAGSLAGTVSITTNANSSPDIINLSGTATSGPRGTVTLSKTTVAFGNVYTGETSAAQSVTLSNTSSLPLTISSITAGGVFAQTNNCGSTVAAGGSCTIQATFSPSAEGAASNSITIVTNATTSPDTIALTGTGVSEVSVTISSDGKPSNVESRDHLQSNIFYFFYFNVANHGTNTLGSSQLNITLTDTNDYYWHVYTTFNTSLAEYDPTTNLDITTYPCTVTNDTPVTSGNLYSAQHNFTCSIGTATSSGTRHFRLLSYSTPSGVYFYTSDINVSASATVGTKTGSSTYNLLIVDFIYNTWGCTLMPGDSDGAPQGMNPTALLLFSGLIILLAMRFKSSRLKFKHGPFLLITLLLGANAQAATNSFSVNFDAPVLGSSGAIYTLGTANIPSKFQFAMDTTYGYGFMKVGSTSTVNLVNHLLTHYLAASYAPTSQLQFDFILPEISFEQVPNVAASYDTTAGIGDIMLRVHIRLLENENSGMGVSLIPYLSLPTGNENNFVGDKYPRGGVKVAGDWKINDRLYAVANLGFEGRESIELLNYKQRGRVLASAGASYKVWGPLKLVADALMTTAIDHPFRDKASTSLEMMGGVTYKIKNVTLNASAGGPIIRSAVTPMVRAQLGASLSFGSAEPPSITPNSAPTSTPSSPKKSKSKEKEVEVSLQFPRHSSEIKNENQETLDRFAEILKNNRKQTLTITVPYTTKRGKDFSSKKTALKRGDTIKSYVESKGISADRITVEAFEEIPPKSAKNRILYLKLERS